MHTSYTGLNCISSFSFFVVIESEHQEAANLQASSFSAYQAEPKNIDASANFRGIKPTSKNQEVWAFWLTFTKIKFLKNNIWL